VFVLDYSCLLGNTPKYLVCLLNYFYLFKKIINVILKCDGVLAEVRYVYDVWQILMFNE